ncbi:hypothetical protein ABPG72_018958 [Tetrahymena utriculariae]
MLYQKMDINSTSSYLSPNKDQQIISRNKLQSIHQRHKSNSMTQQKFSLKNKNLSLSNQINNDFSLPNTYRESTMNKPSSTKNGLSKISHQKHQSFHQFQQINANPNNGQQQNIFINSPTDQDIKSQLNSQKQSYLQSALFFNFPNNINQQLSASFMHGNQDDIQQLKQSLQMLIQREEEVCKGLIQRSNKLNEIFALFGTAENFHFSNENDFTKFHQAVQELSQTLISAAKNEIELGSKCREIERLNLENKLLSRKMSTLKEKCLEQQKVNELLSQRNKQLLEENNKYLILLNTEKKDNRLNTKKVSALEKRVEFILENEVNITLNPNDKLRQSLNELLRENEALKRDLAHKNQEIERNLGNIKKFNEIINRLNQKIDSMKKDPSKYFDGLNSQQQSSQKLDVKSNNQGESTYSSQNTKLIKNDDIDLFSNFVIPQNVGFRIVSLKSDHQNLIHDLIEIGSTNFTKQIMATNNQVQQRDVFNLVASQFLSFKDLSEKVNQLLNDLQILFFQDQQDSKEAITKLNLSLAHIFNAKSAHIWFIQCQQGILTTYENSREKKSLISKGLLSESFFGKKPINSKNARNKPLYYYICEDKELSVVVDTCLIIPIVDLQSNQVKILIEISNSKNEIFSFDEEYLSIILGQFLNKIVTMQELNKQKDTIIKFNQQLVDTIDHLMYAENKFDLSQRIQQSFAMCFGITNFIFYYVEDDNLVKYDCPNSKQNYSLKYGLVGQAALDQKPYIISDVKLSSYYNKLVDLQSILPIFAIPLLDKENIKSSPEENPISACLGVLQIALKQKYKSTQKDMLIDASDGYFGLEETMSIKIQQFCQLIVHSIKQINKKQSN